jgi:hypothetical protein
LTSIVIPASVEHLGAWMFWDTPIETIYVEADYAPDGWHYMWNMGDVSVVWGYSG